VTDSNQERNAFFLEISSVCRPKWNVISQNNITTWTKSEMEY